MGLSFSLAGVETGALQHHIYADFAPGQLGSICLGINGNLLTIHQDIVLTGFDGVLVFTNLAHKATLCGVILQQVSQHFGAGQVIDGHNFIALGLEHLTERKAANAAKPIDCNFNSHTDKSSLCVL